MAKEDKVRYENDMIAFKKGEFTHPEKNDKKRKSPEKYEAKSEEFVESE